MYEPGGNACPVCTSFMDSLNDGVPHIEQYYNFALIAQASVEELKSWVSARKWSNLTVLSSSKTTYNLDYNAEAHKGRQLMALNAFRKTVDEIFHTWAFELFYARGDDDKAPRHPERIWPFCSIYYVTLYGRPGDWFPAYRYG
jgi:predicted dithiol-disulfide oxidoreductase (DUF899 family)